MQARRNSPVIGLGCDRVGSSAEECARNPEVLEELDTEKGFSHSGADQLNLNALSLSACDGSLEAGKELGAINPIGNAHQDDRGSTVGRHQGVVVNLDAAEV